MATIIETNEFAAWRDGLRDGRAKAQITARIVRLGRGLVGDVSPVGSGVSELRIHYGPGYRVYLTWRGPFLVVLLCGGDKGSQDRDIRLAKALASGLED